jgi:UDP-glucose 4-epimerase
MRVLITGGTGYIGSHTAVNVLHNKHDLMILDNYINSSEIVLEKIQYITNKKFLSAKCNIRDKNHLIKIFSDFKPDIVIHFAGLKSVNDSIKIPLDYYLNNVTGTINLLEVMDQFNCQKIIFSSSATVYGKPIYSPCDENHKILPINPYGRSKYFIEEIIKDWTISKDQNKSIILRYFNPVGAHKTGIIGELPKGIPNNLFPYISGVIAGTYKYLSIFGNDYDTKDGTGVRDYVHVEDIALAHVKSFMLLENYKNETINLGTGSGYSVLEILKEFEKIIQKPIPFKIKPRRTGDPAKVIADNKKAKSLLKWDIKNNLNDICKDTINWINNYNYGK